MPTFFIIASDFMIVSDIAEHFNVVVRLGVLLLLLHPFIR